MGPEPSYISKENAEESARGKKPCSGTEVVAGLGEIDEKRLQEYESSLLDIPTDEEKDYYLGLGYDEAFRKMMMTWGVVSILTCTFPLFFFLYLVTYQFCFEFSRLRGHWRASAAMLGRSTSGARRLRAP